LKICDLTQSYSATSGGVRTYLHAKRAFIRSSDHSHVLIVPGETDDVIHEGNLTTYSIKSMPIPNYGSYRFILRLDKVLRILKMERPDIVELGDAYLLPQAGFNCRRQFGSAVLGYYHTDFPTAYIEPVIQERFGNNMAARSRKWAENYARDIYNRCDATITGTAQFKDKLQTMGIENVFQIPLGVDTELFHPKCRDPQLRQELGLGPEDICLIYAGRLDGEKRVELLIHAFEQISDRFCGKILLMGDGPMKPWIQEKSKSNSKIVFIPYQHDRVQLARFMASSDIYVTAGSHETFGLSVIEAQASGLCVLGVNAGALKERVPAGLGVLSEADCPDAMADNMLSLSKGDFRKMGSRAREWVVSRFSWNQTFTFLLRLYQELHSRKEYANRKTA
jgi:alpha-1,6-mannosyltransferase